MRIILRLVLLTLTVLGAAAQSAVETPERKRKADPARGPRPQDDVSEIRASRQPDRVVVFKSTPEGELRMHVFLPPGWSASDRRPAMIFWPGGGFVRASQSQFMARADYFASRGLVTVCAEYRVRGTHGTTVDKCVEDARSAMRWLKHKRSELGIDPDRIVAAGGSAGGTLSLQVARPSGPDAPGEDTSISTRPAAMVLFNPGIGERVVRVVGTGTPELERLREHFEVLSTPQKDEPPSIMFFGTEDHDFIDVSREYCRKAAAQGIRCELWTAEKMRHGFFNRQPWHDVTTRKADEFLAALGYIKGAPTVAADPGAVLDRFDPREGAGPRR